MASYPFELVTLEGKAFSGEVESINVPGEEGRFGVLASHAQMVAALSPGVLELTENGSTRFYVITGGVCDVREKKTIVLCDKAMGVESMEEGKRMINEELADLHDPS